MRRSPTVRRWSAPTGRLATIVLLLAFAAPLWADGIPVLLRNDLTPGAFLSYRVKILGVRTTPAARYTEVLTFEQSGRLTLAVLDKAKEGVAPRAWMMEMEEPEIRSVTLDGEPLKDLPNPKLAGLPPRGVQLRVTPVTSSRADASALGGSLVQRAGVLLALDFAQWPDDLIRPGDTWETPAAREELEGVWSHTYAAVEGSRAQRLAVGEFRFQGRLAGPLEGAATVEKAEGTWKWRVAKRSLRSSSSDVILVYGDHEQPRRLELQVTLELEDREHLPRKDLPELRDQLSQLGELSRQMREGGETEAITGLDTFVSVHADSPWLPVARDLLARTRFDEETLGELDQDRILEMLIGLIKRWQVAALSNQTEPLQPIRATFSQLMKTNRSVLHALSRSEESTIRTLAVFCIAFGEEPEDLRRVAALCGDKEAQVRAWAAYGLAERREENVDPSVLEALLGDPDDIVRQRACMAVQGCVRINSPQRERFFRLLIERVNTDESEAVRGWAAQALDALATKGDLPALIEAEANLFVPPARRQLEATIRRLGGEPRELPDE